MDWFLLILAGLFEVGWSLGLKYTNGFTELLPSVLTTLTIVISTYWIFNPSDGVYCWIQAFFRKVLTPQLHQVLGHVRLNVFHHFLSLINIQWHRVQKKW